MKNLVQEFKAFALKGNMIDLAVAVIIGGAFGAVVSSLVKNIIMPILSYVIPNSGGYRAWHIGRVETGVFIGEIINFLIIALAVFIVIVKVIGLLTKTLARPEAPAAPTTKECPFCLSQIPSPSRPPAAPTARRNWRHDHRTKVMEVKVCSASGITSTRKPASRTSTITV